jgi:hypothetical protein
VLLPKKIQSNTAAITSNLALSSMFNRLIIVSYYNVGQDLFLSLVFIFPMPQCGKWTNIFCSKNVEKQEARSFENILRDPCMAKVPRVISGVPIHRAFNHHSLYSLPMYLGANV